MDKNITILEQQPARSSDHLSRLYIYYSLSFYGESAATIQHLGLGELPLVRAIASLLATLTLSCERERERERERDSSQMQVGTNARGKETGVNR